MLAKVSMRLSPSSPLVISEGPTSKRLPNWLEKAGLLLKILKGFLNCPPNGQMLFLGAKPLRSSFCILKILPLFCSSKKLSNFPFGLCLLSSTSAKLINQIRKI